MKRLFKVFAMLICIALMSMIVISCDGYSEDPGEIEGEGDIGSEGSQDPVPVDYTVSIKDGLGNPLAGVIIEFKDPSGVSKKRVTGDNGIATYKQATAGEYTVTLSAGESDVLIGENSYTLTAESPTLDLILRNGKNTVNIYGSVDDGAYAYSVGIGSYDPIFTLGESVYFEFNAPRSGIYRFAVKSDDENVSLGYYGSPMFVLPDNIVGEEEKYDGKSFELIIYSEETPYVIGINNETAAPCTFSVERIAEAPFNPDHVTATNVGASATLTQCTIPTDAVLENIDVTDRTVSVRLGDDGYYYTSDGKLLYIRITTTSEYLDASLAMLAGYVSENVGIGIGGNIYDEEGNFVAKELYNTMIEDYMGYCDPENGVYPLTEELAKAIRVHGENSGWWDPDSPNYLFVGKVVDKNIAWLFLCCVIAD